MRSDSNFIMFFSRGKGRGHAIPDHAIVNALKTRRPGEKVTFVSYSTGAATLRDLGQEVIDLELPEDAFYSDIVCRTTQVLLQAKPKLIISHEEFAPLCIASAMDIPTIFLTDWFVSPSTILMQSIRYADEVLFLDEPGLYDVPPYLNSKVRYIGYVLRDLRSLKTREQAKTDREIAANVKLFVVVPGGADVYRERYSPTVELLLNAFDQIDHVGKHLLWIAEKADAENILSQANGRSDVEVRAPHTDFLDTIRGADVIVTKGNRIALFESEALGIPSISLSSGNNLIDDHRVGRIRNNVALRVKGLSPQYLADTLHAAMQRGVEITEGVEQNDKRLGAIIDRVECYL